MEAMKQPVQEKSVNECAMAEAPAMDLCRHPVDAVYWNKWNRCVQCHKCGMKFPNATRVACTYPGYPEDVLSDRDRLLRRALLDGVNLRWMEEVKQYLNSQGVPIRD